MTGERIADALRDADWSGVSIGNKALLQAAINALLSASKPAVPAVDAGACRAGFEQQRKVSINVDWFTWQIAWHDAMFTQVDCAALPAAPAQSAKPVGVTPAKYETAVATLRHVIECLRKTGSYTDEEGEATDYLEPLLSAAPQPYQPVEAGEKKIMTRYCQVCRCRRWFTPEGDCVVCIGLFDDAWWTK
jgi:hypothetical protein